MKALGEEEASWTERGQDSAGVNCRAVWSLVRSELGEKQARDRKMKPDTKAHVTGLLCMPPHPHPHPIQASGANASLVWLASFGGS